MSSRIRFPFASDVFAAFPDLWRLAPPPSAEVETRAYAETLAASARPREAIAFLAHLMSKREAIWWGLRCVHAARGAAAGTAAARAVEAWVRTPDDDLRRAAMDEGARGDTRKAETFLALAVARSGGSLTPVDLAPVAAPPEACALAVNAAIVLAALAGEPSAVDARLRACAQSGVHFLRGGDATPEWGSAWAGETPRRAA